MVEGPSDSEIEHRFTHAFHRTVLARYKCSLDLYHVIEDDCGGRIKRTETDDPDLAAGEPQYFEIRYGFRHLADGRICVVAWVPDFESLPEREREAWLIDAVRHQEFSSPDPTYRRWTERTLAGEWNEAGPLEQLRRELHRARAITAAAGLLPLFKGETNPLLHYPIGENSAELLASTVELERLVVEGLDREAVVQLARRVGVPIDPQHGTLSWIKSLLPADLVQTVHAPLGALRAERNRIHRVPAPHSESLAAFDQFLDRARSTVTASAEISRFLANSLGIDADLACRRLEILESTMHPKITDLPSPHADTENVEATVGKTIAKVRIGRVGEPDMGYSRDCIEVTFTDGSQLTIDPLVNVGNWEDRVREFNKREMNVRLDATFVPSGKRA